MTIAYRVERVFATNSQLESWQVTRNDDGYPIQGNGPCLHCDHQMSHEIATESIALAQEGADEVDPRDYSTRVFECLCGHGHLDSDGDQHLNCGRWWLASIRLAPDGEGQAMRTSYDETLLSAAQALKAAVSEDETTVRDAGEKWIAGVASLFGLFGLAGIAFGEEGLSSLPFEGKLTAAILGAGALIAAALSILLTHRAAYGWPVIEDVGDDIKLREWYDARRERLGVAAKDLKNGVGFALASLALLALLLGAVWFWPKTAASPTLQIKMNDESEVCGSLVDSDGASIIRVKKGSGEVVALDPSQIAEMEIVAKCST